MTQSDPQQPVEKDPPGGSYDVEQQDVERLTDEDALEEREKPQ